MAAIKTTTTTKKTGSFFFVRSELILYLNFFPFVVNVLQPGQEESSVVSGPDVTVFLFLLRIDRGVDLLISDVGAEAEREGLISQGPRRTAVHPQNLLLHGQNQLLFLH